MKSESLLRSMSAAAIWLMVSTRILLRGDILKTEGAALIAKRLAPSAGRAKMSSQPSLS